jgi:hypothetical protein
MFECSGFSHLVELSCCHSGAEVHDAKCVNKLEQLTLEATSTREQHEVDAVDGA